MRIIINKCNSILAVIAQMIEEPVSGSPSVIPLGRYHALKPTLNLKNIKRKRC